MRPRKITAFSIFPLTQHTPACARPSHHPACPLVFSVTGITVDLVTKSKSWAFWQLLSPFHTPLFPRVICPQVLWPLASECLWNALSALPAPFCQAFFSFCLSLSVHQGTF